MSWELFEKTRKESETSTFIKLSDGDSIEGVFVGDPHHFYSIFKDRTEYEEKVDGSSFKFRINFAVKENDKWVPKIYTGGATVRDAILDAKAEYGLDVVYKIKRTGKGKDDTRYTILYKKDLDDAGKKAIKEMSLLPLNWNKKEKHVSDSDVPF